MFFKKTMPFLITLLTGVFTFAYFFVPHAIMQAAWDELSIWATLVGGGALVVGAVSMIRTYWKKMNNKADPNRWYAAVTLVCMAGTVIIGFWGGIKPGSMFDTIFKHVMMPLESTMFSLLAFYMASAAFRSFRMKSFAAGLLLFAAIVVMLAQVPVGENISPFIPKLSSWIMDFPNVAGQRAIMIGISIGSAATALKIILGIDKSVFSGSGKE